jgi:hypothetical protein
LFVGIHSSPRSKKKSTSSMVKVIKEGFITSYLYRNKIVNITLAKRRIQHGLFQTRRPEPYRPNISWIHYSLSLQYWIYKWKETVL